MIIVTGVTPRVHGWRVAPEKPIQPAVRAGGQQLGGRANMAAGQPVQQGTRGRQAHSIHHAGER